MEYGEDNKIWDDVITLKAFKVETQLKVFTTFNGLCELHKCGASLKINEKRGKI